MEQRYIAVGKGSLRFLDGGGEMGQRIRAFNWNLTPIGPPEELAAGAQDPSKPVFSL